MQLGAIFRSARLRKGYTQQELADKLSRSRTSITKMESDEQKITLEDAISWAKHTNANDMLIAAILTIDPAHVTILLEQLGQHVAAILLI